MDFLSVIMRHTLFPFAIVLGILWLIFPWFVYRKLTDLIEVERNVEKSLQQILHTLYKNQEYSMYKDKKTSVQEESPERGAIQEQEKGRGVMADGK